MTRTNKTTVVGANPPTTTGDAHKTSFTYTSEGAFLTVTREPDGGAPLKLTTTYEYDDFGNRKKETVTPSEAGAVARVETVTYDSEGRFPVTLTNAEGHSSTVTYDGDLGTITRIEGPNYDGGNGVPATVRRYDDFGRLEEEDRADGTHAVISYKKVDHAGTPFGIDDVTNALVMVETEVVDDIASPTVQFTPVRRFLDAHGREVRSRVRSFEASDYVQVDTVYDSRGRVQKTSSPHHDGDIVHWNEQFYDVLNRVTNEVKADDSQNRQIKYVDFNIEIVDQKQDTTVRVRNALGQIIHSEEYDGENPSLSYQAKTEFEYDPDGNITKVVKLDSGDAEITKTIVTNVYDSLGRRTRTIDPDAGTIDFTYFSTGELETQQTPRLAAWGSTVKLTMAYDKLGRPTSRQEPNDNNSATVTTTWTYDETAGDNAGVGKLTSESMTGFSRDYFYDEAEGGKLTQISTTIGTETFDTDIDYDALGRVTKLTYPASPSYTSTRFAVDYVYNPRGYLERVEDAATSAVYYQATKVNAEGRVNAEYLGDGSLTNMGYLPGAGRLTYTNAARPDGEDTENIQNFVYTYDAIGNIQSRSDLLQDLTETFEYDALNRLTKATVDDGTTTTATDYTYDGLGNLTGNTAMSSVTAALKYDEASGVGPHAVTKLYYDATNYHSFTYDANGNMLTGDTAGNGRTIDWTSYDKPAEIAQGSVTRTFSYGTDRARFKQVHDDGSVATTKVYVGAYTREKNDADTTEVHKHAIYANGQVVALLVDTDPHTGSNTTEMRYLHRDHLGSITTIVDSTGIENLSYDPLGQRRDATDWVGAAGTVTEDRGFTGHEHLDDVDVIHMNGRIYDPKLGRMLSVDSFVADPLSSQSYNPYSYVRNRPLNAIDPSGYMECPPKSDLCNVNRGPTARDVISWIINYVRLESPPNNQNFGAVTVTRYGPSRPPHERAQLYNVLVNAARNDDDVFLYRILEYPNDPAPYAGHAGQYWFDDRRTGVTHRTVLDLPGCYRTNGCPTPTGNGNPVNNEDDSDLNGTPPAATPIAAVRAAGGSGIGPISDVAIAAISSGSGIGFGVSGSAAHIDPFRSAFAGSSMLISAGFVPESVPSFLFSEFGISRLDLRPRETPSGRIKDPFTHIVSRHSADSVFPNSGRTGSGKFFATVLNDQTARGEFIHAVTELLRRATNVSHEENLKTGGFDIVVRAKAPVGTSIETGQVTDLIRFGVSKPNEHGVSRVFTIFPQ